MCKYVLLTREFFDIIDENITEEKIIFVLDIFSDDIFDLIVQESNIYSFQKFRISINICAYNSAELVDFIAVQLRMGVSKLPAYTDYWSNLMGVPKVQDIMLFKKYQKYCVLFILKTMMSMTPMINFIKSGHFLIKYVIIV
jgi:hypothetical protein